MTLNPNAVFAAVLAGDPTTQAPARLQFDPNRPAEPYLDGAWWPRSTELSVELPALLTALSAKIGPVVLIGYRRDAWNAVPDDLDLAGHVVHLQGFVSPNPPTLVVVDDRGQRVTMRVVPPDTDDATAADWMVGGHHPSLYRARSMIRPPMLMQPSGDFARRGRNATFPAARQHRPPAGRVDLPMGHRGRRSVPRCTHPGVRPDPRRAHRPWTPLQQPRRSPRPQHRLTITRLPFR